MTNRPYVLLSCAMSVDGCLDAPGPDRLILSGSEDLDRVDEERARSDAIMVGAGTIRRDDPRLLVRSPARRAARVAAGLPEQPAGVTLTATGDLDPAASFFTAAGAGDGAPGPRAGRETGTGPGSGGAGVPGADGPGAGRVPVRGPGRVPELGGGGAGRAGRLVYCAGPAVAATRQRLAGLAEVADAGDRPSLPAVLADLAGRGIRRLMVEGGARLGGQFLAAGLVDELHLVVAPFFVGDPAAPRFAPPGVYPHGPSRPMTLAGVRRLGQGVLLSYLLGPAAQRAAPGEERREAPGEERREAPGEERQADG